MLVQRGLAIPAWLGEFQGGCVTVWVNGDPLEAITVWVGYHLELSLMATEVISQLKRLMSTSSETHVIDTRGGELQGADKRCPRN